MKMRQNIGIVNAMIRITAGLAILSWCTAKMVKKPWRDSYLVLAFLAAMKVAEGIVRYCPVTDFIQNSGDKQKESKEKRPSEEQENGEHRKQGENTDYKEEMSSYEGKANSIRYRREGASTR